MMVTFILISLHPSSLPVNQITTAHQLPLVKHMTMVVMSITGNPKGTFLSPCSAKGLNSMTYLRHTEEQGQNKILNSYILHSK